MNTATLFETLRPLAQRRLTELDAERTLILSAYPDLATNGHHPRRRAKHKATPAGAGAVKAAPATGRKRRRMSPEARKRISLMMKKRWAERRRAES